MKAGLQNTTIKNMADYGCYFLSICESIEFKYLKEIDVVRAAEDCMDNGWLGEDFYVKDATKIASFLSGKKYSCRASDKYEEVNGFVVQEWYNKKTGFTHFRLVDWDSVKNSITVKHGILKGYRIFKEEN